MRITVLIPTYRRPESLTRCLEGLSRQTRKADEILIVGSKNDSQTISSMQTQKWERLPIREIYIPDRGQVRQLNSGVNAAKGEIIAITDDDAVPHSDWLERIEACFLVASEKVAGVGGRDIVYHGAQLESGSKATVGKVLWYGKVIGNHHLGTGNPRSVDVLKGVNCAYRRSVFADIHFDQRLRGSGAQVHNDLCLGLAIRRRELELIFDPKILVDHYPAERFDEDQREGFNDLALCNMVHNETLSLLDYLTPARRLVYLAWIFLIGTRAAPGLVQFLRLLPVQGTLSWLRFKSSLKGRWQGYLTWHESLTQNNDARSSSTR